MGPEEVSFEMLNKKLDAIQHTLSEQKESKIWKVLLISLPIFLTSMLGAILSKGQAQIQQSIEENGKFLSTGLALSEQYYIRELDACEKIQAQLAPLSELLQDVKVNRPYSRGDANDHLTALNEVFTAKSLYLTRELEGKLGAFWQAGVKLTPDTPAEDVKEALNDLAQIQSRIREDLHIDELQEHLKRLGAKTTRP